MLLYLNYQGLVLCTMFSIIILSRVVVLVQKRTESSQWVLTRQNVRWSKIPFGSKMAAIRNCDATTSYRVITSRSLHELRQFVTYYKPSRFYGHGFNILKVAEHQIRLIKRVKGHIAILLVVPVTRLMRSTGTNYFFCTWDVGKYQIQIVRKYFRGTAV